MSDKLTELELDFLVFYRRKKSNPPIELSLEEISKFATKFIANGLLIHSEGSDVCLSKEGLAIVQKYRPRRV